MKDIDIRRFGSEFFTIEESNLPSDSNSVKGAIISEAFRFALDSMPDPQGSIRKMHINSIRRWVIQKLRAIIPEIEKQDLNYILKESKGPNLLFLGDILKHSKGYYSPAPTRAVNVDENNWILVSGLPTHYFTEAGINVNVKGVGRIIKNTSRSEIEELAIPIQSKESYVGLMKLDKSFLFNLLESETKQIWRPENDWQGYKIWVEGWWSKSDKGFLWDVTPINIRTDLGIVSFWRGKTKYDSFEYWLKVKKGEQESMISIKPPFYKQICLIIDELGGKRRVVKLKKIDGDYRLSINFIPPKSQFRWLHAIGAKFEGLVGSEINWIVPSKAVKSTAEVFEMLSVKTIIQNE